MQHAMTSLSVARLGVQRQAPQPASRSQPARSAAAAVTCSMRQADGTSTAPPAAGRRAVLSAVGLALLTQAPAAQAGYRSQVCEVGDEGRECRERALKDESSLDYAKEAKAGKSTPLVPSNQNGAQTINQDKYVQDTIELAGYVAAFLAADVYDPARTGLIEKIKREGNKWSGLYAPGGSPKRESGRDFYNCLQQLQGWFAFNGIAPLNKSTLDKVTRNLADTRALLEKGR